MAALIPLVLIVGFMYFALIRPQQKRMRAQQALMSSIEEGDEVLTTGGLYGYVNAIEGEVAWVEIAEGVEIRVAKAAIARKVTSGEVPDHLGDTGGTATASGALPPPPEHDVAADDDEAEGER
jgi:preprotein translocase subunit YajC